MLGKSLDCRGHQNDKRGTIRSNGGERRLRLETRMQRDSCADLQSRRGLNVQPPDMEKRQNRQHVVVRRKVMHVLTHHGVPDERLLTQQRAFGAPSGARGVDEENWTAEI